MKTTFMLSIVVITLLITNSESKDFCEAFEENGSKIDFPFEMWTNWTLIIGSEYWVVNDRFNRSVSYPIQFNSNEYRLAFTLEDNIQPLIGLWSKNKNRIDWRTHLSDNKTTFNSSSLNSLISNFNPSFDLQERMDSYHCFCQQTEKSRKFSRRYECFEFDRKKSRKNIYVKKDNDQVIKWLESDAKASNLNINDSTNISDIRSSYKIIAIFLHKDKKTSVRSFYILYQIYKKLVYCFTKYMVFPLECKPQTTLIDCTQKPIHKLSTKSLIDRTDSTSDHNEDHFIPDHTNEPTDDTNEPIDDINEPTDEESKEESDIILIVIMVLVVIVIILVIVIALLCLCKYCSANTRKIVLKKDDKGRPTPDQDLSVSSNLASNSATSHSAFSVKSGVDYTKAIPMNSNISAVESTDDSRPTDLNVKPKN